MSKVKINKSKILSEEHYVLKLIDFDIQKNNGNCEIKKEKYDHGNAVLALPYNTETRTNILTAG